MYLHDTKTSCPLPTTPQPPIPLSKSDQSLQFHTPSRDSLNSKKNTYINQVWWCIPVILALRRQSQEDGEF
jgi:hypothetical protein